MDRFAFVHHRAMNTAARLTDAMAAAKSRPDLIHVVEGDLCWHQSGSQCLFYFHHPAVLTDRLPKHVIDRRRAEGRLHLLEDVLDSATPSMRYVFELKVGDGDPAVAIRALVDRLEDALPGRYWIDAFALEHLALVKHANPAAPTSLHSRLMLGRWVLQSAPKRRPLSIHHADQLPHVDALTLTYKYMAYQMLRAREVAKPPWLPMVPSPRRPIVIGSVPSVEVFDLARRSGAVGCYAKFPLDLLPSR